MFGEERGSEDVAMMAVLEPRPQAEGVEGVCVGIGEVLEGGLVGERLREKY